MIKFTKDSFVDLARYEHELKRRPYIFVNYDKMRLSNLYESSRCQTLTIQALEQLKSTSGMFHCDLNSDNIYTYLTDYCYCPERRFKSRANKSGRSLSSEKILQPLLKEGYAVDFLKPYIESMSLKSTVGLVRNMLNCSDFCGEVDRFGNRLARIGFSVETTTNLRSYYSNSGIVSITSSYNPCITVPEGYALVWGDFNQADFRIAFNLFLKDEKSIEFMRKYSDSYEAVSRMLANYYGEEFIPEVFQATRGIIKQNTLAPVYGAKGGKDEESTQFIQRMTKFLESCPLYVEYKKRINDKYDLGLPIEVNSYFGHLETANISSRRDTTIDFCLNSPIQTATSEIVMLCVLSILDKFKELGYSEDDIQVYYVRHDEPIFMIKKELLGDAWVFKNHESISIDDWSPLGLDFYYGYEYGVENEELTNIAKESYVNNTGKIDLVVPSEMQEQFYPVSKTCRLAIGFYDYNNATIMCIYDYVGKEYRFALLKDVDETDLLNYASKAIEALEPKIYEEGYRGIICHSRFFSEQMSIGNSYVKFENSGILEVLHAEILSKYMASLQAKKLDKEFELNFNESDMELIGSVRPMKV